MATRITAAHGSRLLRFVRETIGHRLALVATIDRSGLDEEALRQSRATFVTLKSKGVLRGCIGNLEASGTLIESLERNGLSAAFHDTRFEPLTKEQWRLITIDISILTPARPLIYRDADDLVDALRPYVDGVILRLGRARATFLPQVWQQLPDPSNFLGQLSRKAGLAADAWRDNNPEILVYQVQSFKEEDNEAGA